MGSSLISKTIFENFLFFEPELLAPELQLEFLVSCPCLCPPLLERAAAPPEFLLSFLWVLGYCCDTRLERGAFDMYSSNTWAGIELVWLTFWVAEKTCFFFSLSNIEGKYLDTNCFWLLVAITLVDCRFYLVYWEAIWLWGFLTNSFFYCEAFWESEEIGLLWEL